MSDLDLLAVWGGLLAMLAVLAWYGDYRRMRRRDLDAVGFMPWTKIFFLSLLGACTLLGLAARMWIGR